MVSDSRVAEFAGLVARVTQWAESEEDIVAVGVVGSWARGSQHDNSDLDLIVLTSHKTAYTTTDGWIEAVVGRPALVVRRAEWGAVTERRLRLRSGFEVEFGFTEPSWASIHPIDPGTAQGIADDGLLPLYDPEDLLGTLATTAG
jgi:predicted nucleotidyltransferase